MSLSRLLNMLVLGFAVAAHADLDPESITSTPPTQASTAPTLQQLFENDRVRVRSWVQPKSNTVVGQQLELNIEVASTGWFSGGTRVGRFELDDAIVLRRNKFAVNSSHREAGNTWSAQLWTITIYPQRSGAFTIPELDIHVSLADPENPTAAISGILKTEVLKFTALLPEEIQNKDITHWIASNEFTVSDEFDKPLDDDPTAEMLRAGDALRRTITLRAENVAAMMLPAIKVSSAPGLAAYMRPARLEDRVNRGRYLAIRREVISYVAEVEGLYTLPEITLHWWNTQTLSLEQIILPAHQLRVGSAASGAELFQPGSAPRTAVYYLMAGVALAALVFLCWKSARIQSWWRSLKSVMYPESRQLKRELIHSYPDSEPAAHAFKTLQWLYAKGLDSRQSIRTHLSKQSNPELALLFEQMMQHAFASEASPLSTEEFRFFIDEADRRLYRAESDSNLVASRLNPRNA